MKAALTILALLLVGSYAALNWGDQATAGDVAGFYALLVLALWAGIHHWKDVL